MTPARKRGYNDARVTSRGPGPNIYKRSHTWVASTHRPPADKRRRRNLRRTRCPRSNASSPYFPARAVSASRLSPVPSPPSLPVTATRSASSMPTSPVPSIPKMFGMSGRHVHALGNLMLPEISRARRQGHELQPAAPKRDRPRPLARSGHRRRH